MKWEKKVFSELFLIPTKNGLYKSKEFHGTGTKIINMGEIEWYGLYRRKRKNNRGTIKK